MERGILFLPDEEQFAVFGQCPHLVLHDEFEFVDVVADGVQIGCHLVVVGYGQGAHVFYPVHLPAFLHHGIYVFGDEAGVLVDFFYQVDVVGRECLYLLRVGKGQLDFVYVVDKLALVFGGNGDDVVHAEIAEHAAFNLDFLVVGLPFDFVAGFQFVPFHDFHVLEHSDAGGVEISVVDEGSAGLAVESAAQGFGFPFVAVSVAVEADGFAGLDVFAQDVEDGADLALSFLDEGVHAGLEVRQGLGHGGVQGYHGAGAVGDGTDGAELEAVAREGEGRRAVAVGVVYHQFGNLRNVELYAVLAFQREEFLLGGVLNYVEQFADLRSEKGGDDGRRCFVSPQTVGVGSADDGGFQQPVVAEHAHQCLHNESDEAEVVFGRLSGCVEQAAVVCREAPVVVLAASVDTGKGLFVEQTAEAVFAGNVAHQTHDEHVVVYGQVALLEDGSQLKLVGCHFIMACLAGNAQFECLYFEIAHELGHTFGDSSEIVVVHLLVFRTLVSHQGCGR